MNLRNFLSGTVLSTLAITMMTGCALIFIPKKQKVVIQTATPGASIIYRGDTLGKDRVVIRKVNKNKVFQQVTVAKEGYKSQRYCFEAAKLTPAYAISILDILLFGPAWEYRMPKLHKYDKVQHVPALQAMQNRKPDEKYLYVDNTSVDVKSADIKFINYNHIKQYERKSVKSNVKKKGKSLTKEDLKIDNTIFSDELNWGLKNMNFIDTTHTIFPNTGNCLYISSTIKKMTFFFIHHKDDHDYYVKNSHAMNSVLCLDMEIEWDIMDYYKQKICTLTTDKRSDLTIVIKDNGNVTDAYGRSIRAAMAGNLEYALMDVQKQLSEKGLLKMTAGKEDTSAFLTVNRPVATPGQRINDYLKSTVSVKVDDGHGSGVILSSDGMIVTNYHVVAGTKEIEVIFNDGTKAVGEVIRKNPDADLALIKVKKDSLIPLAFSDQKDPEIGIDVWAIGTPKSLELGQSVSKGIISGVRNANNMTYLQTDVKISPGNSGGALVNKDGTVMGIVSSKLIGFGTEGVGFAILSKDVFGKLRLKYSN